MRCGRCVCPLTPVHDPGGAGRDTLRKGGQMNKKLIYAVLIVALGAYLLIYYL